MKTRLFAVFAFALLVLGGCSRGQTGGADGAAYVPATGSARGVVVPGALPGIQTVPAGASTAGSRL